ncbi:MAG: hypothetical protein FGM32_00275 [Candidatus Kapabacteria bacterium]|nr:hypothetical protein [Candidatus Kapabacteria bacterium]
MNASSSPDFVLRAAEYLADHKALEAARLATAGIEMYPLYAGGYVMLAKSYAALGRLDDAQVMVHDIARRFPYIAISVEAPEIAESATSFYDDVIRSEVVMQSESWQTLPDDMPVSQPEIVVEEHVPDEEPPETVYAEPINEDVVQAPSQVLRMIESMPIDDDTRIIRSSSVRLIPGLEFTTLRVEGLRSRGRRGIGALPDPPPFRSFHQVRRPQRSAEPPAQRKSISLEELATRLLDAKMPRQSEMDAQGTASAPAANPHAQPILVTDTIAQIYMQQQSYDLAIEAFKTLMSRKPERSEHYQALIRECERKRG